jgi:hypothetical protein
MLIKWTTGVNFINILFAVLLKKVFSTAFSQLQFDFVIFWQKDIGAKAAHNILTKLTTGVNFINILLAAFLNKSVLSSFLRITAWLCNFC